ncbi:MAG: EVE domain-containing protein [Chloroflexia bacterium]|nr:EVE domain-containing protein [Chloroflexia bacterium]
MPNTDTKHWIVVSSVDNWQKTKDLGFTIQGLKSRHRKKAEQMRPGDKIVYYCTGVKAFAGVSTITSEYFESDELIWSSSNAKRAGEQYPFRVKIEGDLALDNEDFVSAEPLARQMTYAKTWPAEHWTLAFQGNVHLVPEEDYVLIRRAIENADA